MGAYNCLPLNSSPEEYDTQRSLSGPPPLISRVPCGERSVSELAALVRAGDLVLFRGATPWSELIRVFTWNNESHVALADRTEAGLFIFESVKNIDGVQDIITNEVRNGVRLVEFGARAEAMFVNQCCEMLDVSVVRLHCSPQQLRQFQERLWAFQYKVAGRPYERDAFSIVASQFPLVLGRNQDDESSMFCSELVAAALRETGVLPARTIASRVTHVMLAEAAATFHRHWATRGVFYKPTVECYQMRRDQPDSRPVLAAVPSPQATPIGASLGTAAEAPESDVVIFL
jgi:hypothetical protein